MPLNKGTKPNQTKLSGLLASVKENKKTKFILYI